MFAQVTAQVVRSGVVDSVHTATVVALEPDGRPSFGSGDPDRVIWPRSCAKVLQAVAMVRAGLQLDGSLLALALASHSGERYHLDGVLRLLGSAGLDKADLQNTADLPLDEIERTRWQHLGESARVVGPNLLGQTRGHVGHLPGRTAGP